MFVESHHVTSQRELTLPEVSLLSDILLTLTHRHFLSMTFSCLFAVCVFHVGRTTPLLLGGLKFYI